MFSGTHLLCCILAALAADTPPPSEATDWPNLRGPAWNALSDACGLAEEWPVEGPPVLWSKEIGQGYSSIIAVGDRVFTQTQTLYGQYVVCLAADSGEEIWRHWYDWPYEAGNIYPGPRATPTWVANRIYFASPSGLIGCLEAETGAEVWTRNVLDDFQGRGTNFGYSSSPLVHSGRVIVPAGGEGASVVALAADTGKTVWKAGSNPASYCPAMPLRFEGREYLAVFLQNSWTLLEASTGQLLYEEQFSHGYDEHAALPLYEEPFLVLASAFRGGAQAFRLERAVAGPQAGLAKPAPAWSSAKFSNDVCSSAVHGGRIYGFDLFDVQSRADRPSRGEFRCLDLATGRILWSTKETGQASVIVAEGKLILFNDRGEIILARENDQKYEPLARAAIFSGELCWTAPALRGDRLYVRSPKRIACVYLGEPAALHHHLESAAVPASELAAAAPHDWLQLAVGGELEFPFEPPTYAELKLWYVAGLLGAFLPAAVFSAAVGGVLRRLLSDRGRAWRIAGAAYWTALMVLGIVATPLGNRLCEAFVFSWPVTLAAVCQFAFVQTAWAELQADRRRARWCSRGAGILMLLVALAYFHFCRRFSMTLEWAFLAGWLAAAPVAFFVARWLTRTRVTGGRLWLFTVVGSVLTFTACFWLTGIYFLVRGYTENIF